MDRKVILLVIAAGLVTAATPVWAHHAFAQEFDRAPKGKLSNTLKIGAATPRERRQEPLS